MFEKALGSKPALGKCDIRTQLPRRSRRRAAKPASARRGSTPSDPPRTPRAARGHRLLTALGGSGSRAPAAGRRGRALRPLRPPPGPALQLPPSPSRRRPSPAPLTLHPGCGSRYWTERKGAERGALGFHASEAGSGTRTSAAVPRPRALGPGRHVVSLSP